MPLTLDQALAKVSRLYRQLTDRRGDVLKLNAYFRGEQPLAYASREWAEFHQGRYRDFSDNWCGVVGNSPAERIRLTSFRIGDDARAPLSDAERTLWRDWSLNEMDAQSSQGFLQSIIAKRSAVIVWGDDDDEPLVTWEHPSQVAVEYDAVTGRRRVAALKCWVEDDLELATLYTADEVWKFQRARVAGQVVNGRTRAGLYVAGTYVPTVGTGGWVQRARRGDDDTWPIENPLGVVPVVEFPNRPMLGGEPLSDIAGTMAMQDAVNLLWAYLFGAADFASMPARVVMGQEPPKVPVLDENGQKVGEKPVDREELTRGRLLWLTGQNAKIGQFQEASLSVFTDVINVAVRHVAAQTRTPVHYIVGELSNVNGETLLAGETGLVKKVEEFQLFAAPPMREVFRLMALVRGDQQTAEACRVGRVGWADAETRTTAQLADAALKDRQIGFPLRWIAQRRYGMSQQDLDDLQAMLEQEADDPLMARVLRETAAGADADA